MRKASKPKKSWRRRQKKGSKESSNREMQVTEEVAEVTVAIEAAEIITTK
jgi:hypothetical protein